MGKQTPFYALHQKSNAKLVDFAGWEMPLNYGSQLEEHHIIRQSAGMFDVSHMGIVDVEGIDATTYLKYLLANNVDRLIDGKALYSCMLNDDGGIIDDLIVYRINANRYRVVINAGTRDTDIAWMTKMIDDRAVTLTERTDLAMLAVQGPQVKDKILQFLPPQQAELIVDLNPFHFVQLNDWFIAKTGYTGEDGVEIIFPVEQAAQMWSSLLAAGIRPCGLGARDTLRLEAGLNLYGSDMDETITPLEANLSWTVSFEPTERDFNGKSALLAQKEIGIRQKLVGLVLQGAGIIRNHQKVYVEGIGEGEVTSGGYAPTLEKSIALARVPVATGDYCLVEIRNKRIPARVIKPPFVKNGKATFSEQTFIADKT